MEVRYRPGGWVAVTGPRTWLLVAADAAAPLVARCWELARAGADEVELVGAIAADGLRAVRDFAVAGFAEGAGQVIVRGAARVELTGTDGSTRVVTAEHVSTWVETRLDRSTVRLVLGGPVTEGSALPLDSGVVRAGGLDIELAQALVPAEPAEAVQAVAAPVVVSPAAVAVTVPETTKLPVDERTTHLPAEGTTEVITHLAWAVAEDPGATRARPATAAAPTLVPAIRCDSGHWNPPHAVACRVCGAGVPPQQPVDIPRPTLGALRLSSGDLVQLDRGVLLGRAPDVGSDQSVRPHVVRLRSPDGDISRNHVEIRLLGWQVFAVDLGSRNGTVVAPPADLPFDLVAYQPVEIVPGTVVSLADDTSFVFEVVG
ncbi:FHA domain-containing protein [Actinokineospora inagensis]|uniref:FHA domain-containing protein n=1 Tax=Actinokineospora inagensis TaxID=103730 RepID=UPI0004061594|nr:FHA domain-containing protein [Actinokineospora inagensis]